MNTVPFLIFQPLLFYPCHLLTEHSIKQEEVGEEEERRVSGAEEMSHGGGVGGGEEGSGPEEPMIDSPVALQDMGPATDGPHDSNARLPNGEFLIAWGTNRSLIMIFSPFFFAVEIVTFE